MGLFCQKLLRVKPGPRPNGEPLGIAGTQFFTGHMPFLLPNQQRQIIDGVHYLVH